MCGRGASDNKLKHNIVHFHSAAADTERCQKNIKTSVPENI